MSSYTKISYATRQVAEDIMFLTTQSSVCLSAQGFLFCQCNSSLTTAQNFVRLCRYQVDVDIVWFRYFSLNFGHLFEKSDEQFVSSTPFTSKQLQRILWDFRVFRTQCITRNFQLHCFPLKFWLFKLGILAIYWK